MPHLDARNWLQKIVCTVQLLMATLVESADTARLLAVLTPSSLYRQTKATSSAEALQSAYTDQGCQHC